MAKTSNVISDDAWNYFTDRWLRSSRPSAALVYKMMMLENETHKLNWQIPSLSTMYRLIENRIPKISQTFLRKGIR